MNILTFDIEEWFHCDFISDRNTWRGYESRIYASTNRILNLLDEQQLKGTFFILGWVAEHYPEVVKTIHQRGHEIGCHSYYHDLAYRMSLEDFYTDTERALKTIEDVIGEKIVLYRAPGFSITEQIPWAFDVLLRLGVTIDCSVFPAQHDYGGFPDFGENGPARIQFRGMELKEFPMNTRILFGKNMVFSGGGFFRLFPYPLIRKWTCASGYTMSYFHPRDFDYEQPMLPQLSIIRKFKSYYGLKGAFGKFEKWVNDFNPISLLAADRQVNWEQTKVIILK